MKITTLCYRGETPMITAQFRDVFTHELVDPDVVTVDVYDPEGELVISAAPMVKDAVGEYHYDVITEGFTVLGEYRAFVDGIRDNRKSTAEAKFTVKAKG